jgi:hypothetical protein
VINFKLSCTSWKRIFLEKIFGIVEETFLCRKKIQRLIQMISNYTQSQDTEAKKKMTSQTHLHNTWYKQCPKSKTMSYIEKLIYMVGGGGLKSASKTPIGVQKLLRGWAWNH